VLITVGFKPGVIIGSWTSGPCRQFCWEPGCQMPDNFRPKIPIWVYFGGPKNGKCGIIYGHLVQCTGRLV
jgi:hypothetical protein